MINKKCKYCDTLNKNVVVSKQPKYWGGNKYPFRCVKCNLINY